MQPVDENDGLLTVEVQPDDSDVIIVVAGELDPHTAPRFEDALREALGAEPGRVVLELSGVTFMDSSGLRVVLAAHEDLAARGIQVVLRSPSDPVRRLLEITDLLTRLDVE